MSEEVGTRIARDDRGAILPIVALSLTVLMVMTAFSVDLGRQMMHRRAAQGVADMVALDLARLLDGRTRSELESDPKWDQTRQEAATRNHWSASDVVATLGTWDPYTQVFTASGPGDVPNAVQVSAAGSVDYFFARVIGMTSGAVNRSAVAAQDTSTLLCPDPPPCAPPPRYELVPRATGVLGSVAAGFRYYADPSVSAQYNASAQARAQILNAALYVAFGMSGTASTAPPPVGLNLDAVSYKGLANAFISLGELASAAGFGSVDQLLGATLTARQLLNAEVSALKASSDVADIAAGNKIASFAAGASSSLYVQLQDLITVTQGQPGRAANINISALTLMAMSADVINGQNFFSTTVNTTVPGAGTIPMRVAIIEAPQIVTGPQGNGPCTPPDYAEVENGCGPHTAQVRIAFDIPTTLDLTPSGIPLVQATTIPVVFEAATAYSMFSSIYCGDPLSDSTTDFRVLSNGVAMHIGSVSNAALQSTTTMNVQAQALLHGSVNIGLASVNLDSTTAVSESKTFKNGAVYSGDVYSNMGVLGEDETHTFVGNDVSNITPQSWRYAGGVGNTSVSTTMFNNLGITDPVLNAAVSNALKTSLDNLDQLLMDPALSTFGVTLAGADGSINKVDCNVHLVK